MLASTSCASLRVTNSLVVSASMRIFVLCGAALLLMSPSKATTSPVAECTNGQQFEKLTCDSTLKATKCFDAKVTCRAWNVEDCCSPIPLHKCLNPLSSRDFGSDCSSPIDAREQCCADPSTHKRAFQALADLGDFISRTEAAVGLNVTQIELMLAQAKDAMSKESEDSDEKTLLVRDGDLTDDLGFPSRTDQRCAH